MKKLILDAVPISRSGNIALYPALAASSVGRLGVAWYEYGSPCETERSDIWHSVQDASGSWSDPVNVSGGVSFNNGPSLIWDGRRRTWTCAWHSWRPPGREPFIVNGDVTNIWYADISIDGIVHSPKLAFENVPNTEYASLAVGIDDSLNLLYQDRTLQLQCLAQSRNGTKFILGPHLPDGLAAGQHGDMAIDSKGTTWVTYVGLAGGIYLTAQGRDDRWSEPRCISEGIDAALTRPKLSFCPQGKAWVSCHSTTWGSRTSRYRVRTAESHLILHFGSDGSPGNYCWTCNALSVRGDNCERHFSFGPDVFSLPSRFEAVPIEECVYESDRGYGFERPPRCQLRKLGNELTRGMFYDNRPGRFRIDIPAGEYEIEIVYSSWVAPTAGTTITFDVEVLDVQIPDETRDEIFLLKVDPNERVKVMNVSNGKGCDENRPSKLVHDARTDLKQLTWTSYGPQKVEILHASFVAA